MAWVYTKYNKGPSLRFQDAAHRERRGLWRDVDPLSLREFSSESKSEATEPH